MSIKKPGNPSTEDMRPRKAVATSFTRPSDGGSQSQLTVRIDAGLHKQFKAATAMADQSMSEVIEHLIREWVASKR
ncbi:plasmid partition protein ParG [Williamsia sp. CHRR-6]|uniref:plasmid partition protein ParG n=1 Tax=Williamsia sp. CHRR-6 TaxID=2835871 RepID=UPI001BDAF04E|nr:plasmid partition protein ParG [Williamsia sp. CHRR-6]MBT0568638.1 ribbon-helix-helix protein, CopG family [Williamsia sp. CHRR-6]